MAILRKKRKIDGNASTFARKSLDCKGIADEPCRVILCPFSHATRQGCIQLGNNYEYMCASSRR